MWSLDSRVVVRVKVHDLGLWGKSVAYGVVETIEKTRPPSKRMYIDEKAKNEPLKSPTVKWWGQKTRYEKQD